MDQIDISNMALGWVGGNFITTIDDETEEAKLCKANYETARQFMLESRAWTFANDRKRLIPIAGYGGLDDFEWTYKFQLPSNCLVVRQVSRSADMNISELFEKSQDALLANVAVLYIKYTALIVDENKYSSHAVLALAHKLAELISIAITENKELKKEMAQLAEYYTDIGGATDGSQSSPGRAVATRLQNARYTGTIRRF